MSLPLEVLNRLVPPSLPLLYKKLKNQYTNILKKTLICPHKKKQTARTSNLILNYISRKYSPKHHSNKYQLQHL